MEGFMVRHLVFWKYGDSFSDEENVKNAMHIKESLEALKDIIPGVVKILVITNPLPSSSGDADVILDSLFESEEALNAYQSHPEHVKAGSFIRSVLKDRKCIDYNEM
jgi:hypothetical protein